MTKEFKAHISVLTVNLIYGANYSITKQVMPAYIQPFGIIVIRVLPCALLFFLAGFLIKKEKILREDKIKLILCALFGVAINQMLFFKGLSLTVPINGALIMTTNPILVLLMGAIIIKERVSWTKVTGIIIGISGAISLIVYGKNFSLGVGSMTGDVLIFINSVSFAIFIIMVKPLMKKYHPITISKWIFFFGSFMILPFGYDEFAAVKWNSIPFTIWLCILFIVLGVTFIAYLMNIFALRTLSPTTVSSYIYFQPMFATIMSLIMGEGKPHLIHFVSSALIFTGVYLVSKPTRRITLSS